MPTLPHVPAATVSGTVVSGKKMSGDAMAWRADRPGRLWISEPASILLHMEHSQAKFANDAFYLAFAARDMEHMDALWARHCPLICLHPGWPALTTREEIMASWQRILDNPQQPAIEIYGAQAFDMAAGVAVVCYELLEASVMVATNLFVEEDGAIVLVHHQAGPCGQPPAVATGGTTE